MIYKRGASGIYWYSFKFAGRRVRASTHQTNDNVARNMEAAHRARLAAEAHQRKEKALELDCRPDEVVRCRECEKLFASTKAVTDGEHKFCSDDCHAAWLKKQNPTPTLRQFIESRFRPWAKSTFEKARPKSWLWYRTESKALLGYEPIANAKLDKITTELVAGFAAHREALGRKPATVNSALRVLRSVLNRAVEWGLIQAAPKIKKRPGERHRDRVISVEEEASYLKAAPEPLRSVVVVLLDTGLRPEECFRLSWEHITWSNGRYGSLEVTHGKTRTARRVLPMTPRVRHVLESRWEAAGRPEEGWVWPAPTRSGHFEGSSVRKQHAETFEVLTKKAAENHERPPRPWVLYSCRHTFLTRLGMSGCDAWTLARIAGHSTIAISARYVHSDFDASEAAISRLTGGHKRGHRQKPAIQNEDARLLASSV